MFVFYIYFSTSSLLLFELVYDLQWKLKIQLCLFVKFNQLISILNLSLWNDMIYFLNLSLQYVVIILIFSLSLWDDLVKTW